jgi:uncharacterized Fe-S center protein
MPKAQVFFTDVRVDVNRESLLDKLARLIRKAGIETIDFKNKFVAIKIHFGETGNLSFLRPNYAKRVVDVIRPLGALPFLTDCNTLYVGRRKNALDHLDCAMENGFSPLSCGCQMIIADGLKGTDDVAVPVRGGEYVKTARIGRAVMDADIVVSLNHFKGHECTGFGGAIKNIGMGCGSRAGKMEQHMEGKPSVLAAKCRVCGRCLSECGQDAIAFGADGKARIDEARCVGCGRCIGACNFDAVENANWHSNALLSKKMAEYTQAVLDGRPHFHINVATQISPHCDCHGSNDAPIIPDVGIFASFDPVAVDQAAADMCLRQPVLADSMAGDAVRAGAASSDPFGLAFPNTDWRDTLAHAEKIGVGTRAYELTTV